LKIQLIFHLLFPRNTEGEFFCFSSNPLFDSSNHEDVDKIIDSFNHRCHDLFTLVFNHGDDYIKIYFSKPLVYDDLSIDEVETS